MKVCVLILLLFSFKLRAENNEIVRDANCQGFNTCDSCVQSENDCHWCYQTTFAGDRCGSLSTLRKSCNSSYIFSSDEKSAIHQIISDKLFNDVTNPDNVDESVQIKPQRLKVKLRPRQPLVIDFKYRPSKDYPLDLYYLMDLTYTMQQDLRSMAALGKELTELLQDLTEHFRVGFGYYSDKVAMPFAKMTKGSLANPCSSSGGVCEKGFDFVHVLDFTSDVGRFIEQVNKSKTTSNLDNLEGGLDALQQIILCANKIKWRINSRKIIVVATDGTLHVAGDGLLAGAVKRNPNHCLLDENGIYKGSLMYDYPSVEELYHRLLEHKMNVLFAIKEDAIAYYENLNKLIPSVTYVGLLAEKSTNVLNLVKKGYFNVVKTVQFSVQTSQNLRASFKSKCMRDSNWINGNSCDNIEEGKEYEFRVELEVNGYPEGSQTETIVIEEKNIDEKLVIEVEYIGKCRCLVDSPLKTCSGHGSYSCGVCNCNTGWKGANCEIVCGTVSYEECRLKNETYTSSTCHGRGDCECGRCICDESYAGKYCQERQCPRGKNGQICSGYSHGTCEDGTCVCSDLYTDADCSCIKSQATCLPPETDAICNDFGYCRCGKCVCAPNYMGEFCETCTNCTEPCVAFEDCLLETLKYSKTTSLGKCKRPDGTVYVLHLTNETIGSDVNVCYFRQDHDSYVCEIFFKYDIKGKRIDLLVYQDCKEHIKAGALVGIIVGAIIAAGFVCVLAWKAKLMNDDRREYARFKKSVSATLNMGNNPLYNSPIRTYEMPIELQRR